MRRFLLAAAVPLIAVVHTVTPVAGSTPASCYVVAIALLIDDVKDVRDIKYHRVIATGIRKLDAVGDSTEVACEVRDATVPMIMRQAADARLRGTTLKPPQVQRSFVVSHSSLAIVQNEIKRYAIVAHRYAGSFTRVESVSVDVPTAPRAAELPLPALTATEAEAAACAGDNKALEQSKANYRWAC